MSVSSIFSPLERHNWGHYSHLLSFQHMQQKKKKRIPKKLSLICNNINGNKDGRQKPLSVRKTSTCSTNTHSSVSRAESETQSWNSRVVFKTGGGKHLLTGVEPWVMSNINRGHTRHSSKPRRTRCTLEQIWPLALIATRRSRYRQTQPKTLCAFLSVCGLKHLRAELSDHIFNHGRRFFLWSCW